MHTCGVRYDGVYQLVGSNYKGSRHNFRKKHELYSGSMDEVKIEGVLKGS